MGTWRPSPRSESESMHLMHYLNPWLEVGDGRKAFPMCSYVFQCKDFSHRRLWAQDPLLSSRASGHRRVRRPAKQTHSFLVASLHPTIHFAVIPMSLFTPRHLSASPRNARVKIPVHVCPPCRVPPSTGGDFSGRHAQHRPPKGGSPAHRLGETGSRGPACNCHCVVSTKWSDPAPVPRRHQGR